MNVMKFIFTSLVKKKATNDFGGKKSDGKTQLYLYMFKLTRRDFEKGGNCFKYF